MYTRAKLNAGLQGEAHSSCRRFPVARSPYIIGDSQNVHRETPENVHVRHSGALPGINESSQLVFVVFRVLVRTACFSFLLFLSAQDGVKFDHCIWSMLSFQSMQTTTKEEFSAHPIRCNGRRHNQSIDITYRLPHSWSTSSTTSRT